MNYLLFVFTIHEDTGGWEHYRDSFPSAAFAKKSINVKQLNEEGYSNAHIVDLSIKKIILKASFPQWKWRAAS